jgi:hypothetical protein
MLLPSSLKGLDGNMLPDNTTSIQEGIRLSIDRPHTLLKQIPCREPTDRYLARNHLCRCLTSQDGISSTLQTTVLKYSRNKAAPVIF